MNKNPQAAIAYCSTVKVRSTSIPYLDKLIEQMGGEDFLRVMINAKDFEYDFWEGEPSTLYPIGVKFSFGWDKRWVCTIVYTNDEYFVFLRECPLTKTCHEVYHTYCHSAAYLKSWIELNTKLVLFF